MSVEITLCGIEAYVGCPPRVVAFEQELGFSGLLQSLEYVTKDRLDVLRKWDVSFIPGFCQFQVLDIEGLLRHIEQHPYIWDSVAGGFEPGLRRMQEQPQLEWWFHVHF